MPLYQFHFQSIFLMVIKLWIGSWFLSFFIALPSDPMALNREVVFTVSPLGDVVFSLLAMFKISFVFSKWQFYYNVIKCIISLFLLCWSSWICILMYFIIFGENFISSYSAIYSLSSLFKNIDYTYFRPFHHIPYFLFFPPYIVNFFPPCFRMKIFNKSVFFLV